MRNNMTASMFDLSMQDKPRSRLSKLKDKVRGKKKDGFSDSASAIVPSVTQVLTDSEGEGDAQSETSVKKKSKLKTLFAPKSNLQRNISQSMSTLGTLPEKNSSLSGSRSSGLNVESPDVKKKFKFFGHKRTDSSDSKVSLGPFALLSRSKQSTAEQSNLCINGSHVYAEEPEPKSGSSLSLNSSGRGSVEDVRKQHARNASDASSDSFQALSIPSYRPEPWERSPATQQTLQKEEEEKAKMAAEKRVQDMLHRQEEQEKRRREEQQKKQAEEEMKKAAAAEEEEEEERKRREEQERKRKQEEIMFAEEERKRKEEEATRKVEEQKRQEDATVTDKLSSLFGIGRKKEEPPSHHENHPTPAPRRTLPETPHVSTNPFEEIPLNPSPPNPFIQEGPEEAQKEVLTPNSIFSSRTTKVSAVKPRLEYLEPETDLSNPASPTAPTDPQSKFSPSTLSSDSSLSSVPFDSVMFSSLHSSLAPPNVRRSSSETPQESVENLSVDTSSMSEKKRKAPIPPGYPSSAKNVQMESQNFGQSRSVSRSISSGLLDPMEDWGGKDADVTKRPPTQRPVLPLPDYESLYPKRRHGVQGQSQWDHIIAEVTQRKFDQNAELCGPEMSVDGPVSPVNRRSVDHKERSDPNIHVNQKDKEDISVVSVAKTVIKKPLLPPKVSAVPSAKQQDEDTVTQNTSRASLVAEQTSDVRVKVLPSLSAQKTDTSKPQESQDSHRISERKVLDEVEGFILPKEKPAPAPPTKPILGPIKSEVPKADKDVPTVKPRQRLSAKDSLLQTQQEQTSTTELTSEEKDSKEPAKSHFEMVALEKLEVIDCENGQTSHATHTEPDEVPSSVKTFVEFDPFPSNSLLSKDPWVIPQEKPFEDNLFAGVPKKTDQPGDQRITPEDFDKIFSSSDPADPFTEFSHSNSAKLVEQEKQAVPKKASEAMEISSKKNRAPQPPVISSTPDPEKTKKAKPDKPVVESSTDVVKLPTDEMDPKASTLADIKLDSLAVSSPFGEEASQSEEILWDASEPLRTPAGDVSLQHGVLKTPLRAWISPSEVQPFTVQSNGGGPTPIPRRPHPVKPLSSIESQPSSSLSVTKDLKSMSIFDLSEKPKVAVSGPYTQLTQEELITLVVKQQGELSKKDAKIVELEEYIDNLLVRVMEEQPNLLLMLNDAKSAY
ncbi:rab11 family-interacting protein 1 isoform X2 [Denticeps clupeoides]|nr:rab11 family-interacting protein 1-like isoform X2 [Denticeps clupeoides]